MKDPLDVAIIGAGAAGIAAARYLAQAGRSALLVEALPRIGGRACTENHAGLPLDLGCAWLHSADRNPLAALAQSEGLTLDRGPAAWGTQYRDLGAGAETRAAAGRAQVAFRERLLADLPADDRAGAAVPADDWWRPFLEAVSGFANGVELDGLSARDYLAYEEASTPRNWRLPGGMGAFIAAQGRALRTALGTRVTGVTRGRPMRLETHRGPIEARAVIVAVSTNVLASGAIRFDPGVEPHLHAASRLPLGLANKVFLGLADPEAADGAIEPESHLLGRFDSARTASYYLRPFGRPVIECFLGGLLARELEAAGRAAAVDFVTAELRDLLGAEFARGLRPLAVTAWGREPTILGSYSHALPGMAPARGVLAAPVDERLVFAGEDCSSCDFSTAHGAWQSGIAAAEHVARAL